MRASVEVQPKNPPGNLSRKGAWPNKQMAKCRALTENGSKKCDVEKLFCCRSHFLNLPPTPSANLPPSFHRLWGLHTSIFGLAQKAHPATEPNKNNIVLLPTSRQIFCQLLFVFIF